MLAGDIVTCAGSWLYLWDINGRPQTSVDTAAHSPTAQPNIPQQILCVCCSQYNEWDRENVIMTGSADGVVRMWSLDYVEVPEGGEKDEEVGVQGKTDGGGCQTNTLSTLAKKMSLSNSGDCLSSLREAIAKSRASEHSEASSDTEGDDNLEEEEEKEKNEKVEVSNGDKDDISSGTPGTPVPTQKAANGEEKDNNSQNGSLAKSGRNSDGFVVVSSKNGECVEATEEEAATRNDGYSWTRRLVFRAKLTMHTAFERSDNVEPAAVTALAISKDHRTIYVGDEKGRVFSWAISSKPGKGIKKSFLLIY